jgi:serine protease AprX
MGMTELVIQGAVQRSKAVWGPKRTLVALLLITFGLSTSAIASGDKKQDATGHIDKHHSRPAPKAKPGLPSANVKNYKLDDEITRRRDSNPNHTSQVIVTLVPGAQLPAEFKQFARANGKLDIINGQVLDLPNSVIRRLEAHPAIFRVHEDRATSADNYRTSQTVGAWAVRQTLGYTGAGIGVAVIDSGITAWHDDLTKGNSSTTYPYGNQRVSKFVDFVANQNQPYDDYGHGTHVAGIIAGNGYDSGGQKAGIAPGASLVVLKVLDGNGQGSIANIIAALNWVATNYQTYNIRVVNMSVGARVKESYWTDPLTLATKKLTDLGITVVAAAGNFGSNSLGQLQYGGIAAPGNAPWVLTVGASSTMGTLSRNDDTMASFSSSGPTFIDYGAKPDLVAPGVGTMSLSDPGGLFYSTKASSLIGGTLGLGFIPYLSLSGTSMACPVVAGTVALMLQANPNLTPNLIKAILEYTAQQYNGYSTLRQGAGFLNSLGAVKLAKFYADNRRGSRMPVQGIWSQTITWGNHRISGGYLNPKGNAWSTQIVWGAAHGLNGELDNIVWGTDCGADCDNIVWGTNDMNADNIVWGTAGDDNIVWGTGGMDNIVWGTSFDNIVWGTDFSDNIVWGTDFSDNIVWGTDCGGADCDNIVWGTSDVDNIVWGTALASDNIVWGTSALDDNIVWGTSFDGAGGTTSWASSVDGGDAFGDDSVSETPPDPSLEFEEIDPSTLPVTPETLAIVAGGL